MSSIGGVIGTCVLALAGGLGLRAILAEGTHEPVMEDEDNAGYFKRSPQALPACPDTADELLAMIDGRLAR